MKTRKLGSLDVSAIGLGCMGMSVAYGERDEPASIDTVHAALDNGVTLIDTADMYGNGHNEELLSRALDGRRDKAILATKFGNLRTPDGKQAICGRPDYVIEACDKSLARLRTDHIDLYYQHRVDPDVPIEDTVGAMASLIEAGKVRYLGLSEAGPETIRRAHATHPITALQTEYSLWSRDVETGILETCRALGIGFVAYSPLGRGFLTGEIPSLDVLIENDRRRDHPRYDAANLAQNLSLVDAIRTVAARHHATPAQIAIAWVLSRGDDIVPIPGTKKTRWLNDNMKATEITLETADLSLLDDVFKPGVAAGTRYPAGAMKALGRCDRRAGPGRVHPGPCKRPRPAVRACQASRDDCAASAWLAQSSRIAAASRSMACIAGKCLWSMGCAHSWRRRSTSIGKRTASGSVPSTAPACAISAA